MERIARYSEAFDPVAKGHPDAIRAASRLHGRLAVGLGARPGKTPFPRHRWKGAA